MEHPRPAYWSKYLPLPSPEDLPNPGAKLYLLHCRGILNIEPPVNWTSFPYSLWLFLYEMSGWKEQISECFLHVFFSLNQHLTSSLHGLQEGNHSDDLCSLSTITNGKPLQAQSLTCFHPLVHRQPASLSSTSHLHSSASSSELALTFQTLAPQE